MGKKHTKHSSSLIFLPLLFVLFCMGVVLSNKDFLYSFIARGAGSSCPTSSAEQYGKRGLNPPDLNAESNPEIVLAKRGYASVGEAKQLVSYGFPPGEGPDPNAPQLGTMLGNGPNFSNTYQVYKYDWAANRASSELEDAWPVNLLGFSSQNGQSVYAPKNGYNIGGGYQYMLIYASPTSVTMNVIGDDNAIEGYAMHIDGFCVDPNLVSLYRQLHSQGRREMPAVYGGQKIGTTNGSEVRVAMRDSGDWLDPRSKGDWWQDMSTFPNPTSGSNQQPQPTIKPTRTPKTKDPTATSVPPSPTLLPGISPSITPTGFIPSPTVMIPTQDIEDPIDLQISIVPSEILKTSPGKFTFFEDTRLFIGSTVDSIFQFFRTVAP